MNVSLWNGGPRGNISHGSRTAKLFDFETPSSFQVGLNKFTAPAGAFAYQQVAAEAEALLVDAEWAAPEPVAVEVHADGNGRTALGVGNAEDNGTPERQRSLSSSAEFMAEEPAKPERRGRDEAPTLSLFEWALERAREAEPAGAGR